MKRDRLTDQMQRHGAASLRREITDDFKYDKKKLKHLKHILHNVTVALGTLSSALHEFSRVKGPDISPDGMLGGLGYIMPIKEIKEILNGSIKNLSDIADSLADEFTNPNWKAQDDTEVKKLIKEKEEVEDTVEETSEGEAGPEEEAAPEEQEPESSEDETLAPKDVVTSEEVQLKRASNDPVLAAISQKVQETLVRFSSRKN